ncbi:2-dehydro-3-deoxygluconokinase [compost metagenome]
MKVLSFGELLLRICPDTDGQWLADNELPFYVGGAELNVATALALWEVPSAYFSALPDNFMSTQILNYVDKCNIDSSRMQLSGDRLGLYYLPKGKDLKNAGVIYDRANSSFASIKPNTLNWDEILQDISWFHFSAICPALNQDAADLCLEAVKAASERGITISIDLNYRAKLWKFGKEPIDIIPGLVEYCDLVMGNIWAAEKMLGITLPTDIVEIDTKENYLKQAEITSKEIINKFPKCKHVANTFRFDYKAGIRYYTTLFTENQLFISKEYLSEKILDRVGSGDCYMGGLIYGFYNEHEPQQILEFATGAAYNKLYIPSDCTTSTVQDIHQTIAEND